MAALVLGAPRELPPPALGASLLAATVIASVFKLRLPLHKGSSTLSAAHVVDFVALMALGAGTAMIIAAIGTLIQCTVRVRRRQPLHRAAFSVAAYQR